MSTRLYAAALLGVSLLLPACWNGSYNEATSAAGGRFHLTIEASRTDVAGTHFLVDSATGDLWRLAPGGGSPEWVRLADAPEDAADLAPPEPVGDLDDD